MGDLDQLLQSLSVDDRIRGHQFERICKWFLTNDPYYESLFQSVWLWKEWPSAWSRTEAGIDLVAEDRDGLVWAVQCKAYASDRKIPKSELNKFLSESNRKEFDHRLLVSTTTTGLHHIAQGTVDSQDKPVSVIDLRDLATSPVDWPTDPAALNPSKPRRPAQPRDYQRDALSDVAKGFETSDRGQLIMACGTGKTLTSLFIREALDAQRTLVLVPSLSLLKQTMRVWYANKTVDFDSRPVCSDDTVRRDEDAAVAHISDLGMPVTTKPSEIAAFLRRGGTRVLFATYQSSPQIAEAFTLDRVPAFDLVIADEAHRCAGPVSSDFATILDSAAIPAEHRLFMTATPRYFTGRLLKAAKEADFEYASMDDETKFGKVFHRLGFSTAIQRGLLTDYQVAIIGVDDVTYKEWAEEGTVVTLDGKTPVNARVLAGQIGLAKAMRKYDLRRIISFHSRVSSAKKFAASVHDVLARMPAAQRPSGRLWSKHASGDMPAGERYRLLEQLSGLDDHERGLLTNARCLAEGVDVPALDGVAFIDPRRSEVDIVQAVGRAIRNSNNKAIGTIVIPVFIDAHEEPELAMDSSVFKPVWDVIKAIRAHDDELGILLDDLRRELGRRGGVARLPAKIHIDIPAGVGSDFLDAFEVRLLEETTATWEFLLGLLESYVTEHGDTSVPRDYIVGQHRLGIWVGTQRAAFKNGTLSESRILRLNEIPTWTWGHTRAGMWELGLSNLEIFVHEHGHACVPAGTITDGFQLGRWVNVQRREYLKSNLTAERVERLQSLPGWVWDSHQARWAEGYRRLRRYSELHGHTNVARNEIDDGFKLGQWVRQQRGMHGKGKLDLSRKQALLALPGWSWTPRDQIWEERFLLLLEHVSKSGDALVPREFKTAEGFPLGQWLSHQRQLHDKGRLESDRVARLAALPGWAWSLSEAKWNRGFRYLTTLVELTGESTIAATHETEDGYPLGQWVAYQRRSYLNGTLSAERVQRLGELPGWSWNRIDP